MISLDATSSIWLVATLAFLLGTGLGCIVAYLLVARGGRTHELEAELNQLNERFTDYRDQVTGHFMHTSELVQEMTQSYRKVYEHLATGAQHLCDDSDYSSTLGYQQSGNLAKGAAGDTTNEGDTGTDDLAELKSIKNDIDELLGESPRISDLDIEVEATEQKPLQH
jgi:uncharacterized membrane-anchored protein YhcB (DUF1043 family)